MNYSTLNGAYIGHSNMNCEKPWREKFFHLFLGKLKKVLDFYYSLGRVRRKNKWALLMVLNKA